MYFLFYMYCLGVFWDTFGDAPGADNVQKKICTKNIRRCILGQWRYGGGNGSGRKRGEI